jgi:hypothetical protein
MSKTETTNQRQLQLLTTGSNQIAIGYQALQSLPGGNNNIAIGVGAISSDSEENPPEPPIIPCPVPLVAPMVIKEK